MENGIMRLALWQTQGFPGDVAANLSALEQTAKAASAAGARLLLLPELWLSGYNVPDRMAALAEPHNGPSAVRIAEIAAQHGIAIAYGYPERSGDGFVFNSVQVIEATGQSLANYRKTHLYGEFERALFEPGDCILAPIQIDGWKISLLICFDVEFPEIVRRHALAGADLILAPTALTDEFPLVPEIIVRCRAIESQLFIAYCDRSGSEGAFDYLGMSCIAGPNGERIAQAGAGETLMIADLDLGARARAAQAIGYVADRRPELYGMAW
jgi:predicted amidohydrolase